MATLGVRHGAGTIRACAGLTLQTAHRAIFAGVLQSNHVAVGGRRDADEQCQAAPDAHRPARLDYEWNGLDDPPKCIDVYVETRLPNGSSSEATFEQVGTEGETVGSLALESSSAKSYSFQNAVSILNHSVIDNQDFEKTGDGWTKDTAVDVQVRTVLTDESGTTYSDTPQAAFTVTLTNEKGSVNSGGTANTGGSAK